MKNIKAPWKNRRRFSLNWWQVTVVLIVCSVLISVTVVAIQPGALTQTLRSFWNDKLLFLLNGFPIAVLVLLFWAVFGNPFYGASLTALLCNLLSYANLIKTECRNDPLIPGDVLLIREATNAVGEYSLDMHWGILALIVLFSVVLLLLGQFSRCAKPKWFWRVGCAVLVIAAFVWSMATVYPSTSIYDNRGNMEDKANVPLVFERCGFPYCFLHNYQLYPVAKPDGYSEQEAEQWAQEGMEYSQPNVQPNVIFVMCEAFSDLSEEDAFAYTPENDPLADYKAVASSAQALSGHIVVSNFGAGTANTEFDILTGIQTNMLTGSTTSAFRVVHRNLNSLPRAYARAGYNTYFMHPGYDWFYNRESVYSFLGISDQTYNDAFTEADKKGIMISDEAFLRRLTADIDERIQQDAPLFVYSVTIQNHQAYPYSKYGFRPDPAPVNVQLTDEQTETLAVYMEGVRDSSRMLRELTEYLDSLEEPTLLVFFGDHRPALLNNQEVYRALGIQFEEEGSAESVLSTYKTPFLLYANRAYADSCDFSALALPESISSNYLGAAVYELTGMTGTDPYFDTLESVRRALPIISHGYYTLADGSTVSTLPDDLQALYEKLDKWKYYRLMDEPLIE